MTSTSPPEPTGELPYVRTPLVGRITELAAARTLLLDDAAPIVTVTGPGGVGKTRLALAVARETAPSFADGAYFADLTPVREPALVLPAIAQVLGVRPRGDQVPFAAVAAFLKARQVLLVLDNFEQVLPAAPEIAALLASCPALQVLSTSRAPLRVRGEHLLPVPPLPLPAGDAVADIDLLGRFDAVTLFTQRARAANQRVALTEANAATVADICRRTDGLPLAIELAAARLRHLSLEELRKRLEHRLGALADGDRDAPARQRTLRDTIAWSYDLLTPGEQSVFRRLAVFVGGFEAEAALAVVGGDGITAAAMFGTLVDQNLVQRVERFGESVRFGMLETVREFAVERLALSGDMAASRKAHAAYFLELAEQAERGMYGTSPGRSLDTLEVEYPNLRAALDYFAATGDASSESWLASLVAEFWQNRGRLAEGIACLTDALGRGRSAEPIPRAKAMIDLALLVQEVGDCERALELATAAERLARTVSGEEYRVSQVLFVRAWNIAYCLEAWGEVVPLLEEALERIAAARPDSPLHLATLADLGWALTRLGEVERGRRMIEEARDASKARNRGYAFSKCLTVIGLLDQEEGHASAASDSYRKALEVHAETRFTLRTVYPLAGLAGLAMDRGNAEWAAHLLGMIEAVWQQTGAGSAAPQLEKWRVIAESARRDALAHLGAEQFAVWFEAGRALPVEAAITEAKTIAGAIGTGETAVPSAAPVSRPIAPPLAPSPRSPGDLSRREREVLTLLAHRWTAPEIADRLSLSPRTIESHVASIYNKLGVSSRRDAITAAVGHGLV